MSAASLWNPDAYAPRAAFLASVRDLAGPRAAMGAPPTPSRPRKGLRVFAENNHSSLLDSTESPTLTPLIAAFRTAYEQDSGLDRAAAALKSSFTDRAATPEQSRTCLANPGFLAETSGWLDKLGADRAAPRKLQQCVAARGRVVEDDIGEIGGLLAAGVAGRDGVGVGEGGDGQQSVALFLGLEGHLDDHVVDAGVGDDHEQVLGAGYREVVEAGRDARLAFEERVVEDARGGHRRRGRGR